MALTRLPMVDTYTEIFFIRFDPLGVAHNPGRAMIDSQLAESLSGPGYRRKPRDVAA